MNSPEEELPLGMEPFTLVDENGDRVDISIMKMGGQNSMQQALAAGGIVSGPTSSSMTE